MHISDLSGDLGPIWLVAEFLPFSHFHITFILFYIIAMYSLEVFETVWKRQADMCRMVKKFTE